jgi:uncharacterized membrane protein
MESSVFKVASGVFLTRMFKVSSKYELCLIISSIACIIEYFQRLIVLKFVFGEVPKVCAVTALDSFVLLAVVVGMHLLSVSVELIIFAFPIKSYESPKYDICHSLKYSISLLSYSFFAHYLK